VFTVRGFLELFDLFAPDIVVSHQALDPFVIHMESSVLQLFGYPDDAVGVARFLHHIPDLSYQKNV